MCTADKILAGAIWFDCYSVADKVTVVLYEANTPGRTLYGAAALALIRAVRARGYWG